MGKTHLLKAIAGELRRRPDHLDVLCVSGEVLLQQGISALRRGRIDTLREQVSRVDVLLVDDVAILFGHPVLACVVGESIAALRARERQVVLSSEGDLLADASGPECLRAILGRGAVVRIGRPSVRTRLALVRAFAGRAGVWFCEDAMHALAYHGTGSARDLEAAVSRCAHLVGAGAVVDLKLATTVLHERLRQVHVVADHSNAETIVHAVCAEFGVDRDRLVSPARDAVTARARQVAMYLLREDGRLTYAAIAQQLVRDHSTVIHGCARVADALAEQDAHVVLAVSAVRQNVLDTLN